MGTTDKAYWKKYQLNEVSTRRPLSFVDAGLNVERLFHPKYLPAKPVVLDIGCGPVGACLQDIARRYGGTLFGVDISILRSDNPEVILKEHDVTTGLPFPDEHFDLTYSMCLLEHLDPAEQDALVREAVRVTKPNGHFIFNTLNPSEEFERSLDAHGSMRPYTRLDRRVFHIQRRPQDS